MKKANKKPTAFEITELIIKAVVAIAALITAIRWWQVNEGRKPLPPLGYLYYIIVKGDLQVKKNSFWFILLVCLLIIYANIGLTPAMRILFFAYAVIIIIDIIKQVRRIKNERKA